MESQSRSFTVEGKVVSRLRAGVGGLRVEIVDRDVGQDRRVAEATTNDDGSYRVTFTIADLRQRGKERPDLQARVFAGKTPLGASEVRYNASNRETLNILLPEKANAALASEYETLTASLSVHFKGNLRDLKETGEQQDITYLANKTGWDARAVALAALADQFSARTRDASGSTAIAPAFFYALFRAGLPANENVLYRTDAKFAAAIWKQGVAQGVIPAALEERIPQAVEHFQRFAATHALEGPALAGVSSLKELLAVSLGNDVTRHRKFAELQAAHGADLPGFWEAVRSGFGAQVEKRLKLDGQLAYLTINNAPLIRKLHEEAGTEGLNDTLNLVERGYHRAEKWREVIGNCAIPPEIPGENEQEKRARYTKLLAAQVRLSYPTAVVAQMVKNAETKLGDEKLSDKVHAFLSEHQDKFEIGMQPVEQYIARNSNLQIEPEVTKEITRIQRVYQITPTDDAMNALLKKGLDSAYKIVRYDRDKFVETFKDQIGGEANARLTYAKAQQVHNAVLNIATSYLIASTAPAIGVHSDPRIIKPKPKGRDPQDPNAADLIAYPTLEGLFGEMDYCECQHCRSILSPAAYLVDLLLFIDRPPEEIPPGSLNPQTVLFDRRPDIQHLPLTCENTNTPLPYIDLVNETLEYYITNNLSLTSYTGHTTDGSATPEELLASPMFVRDAAYTTLAGEHFPSPLPFHQPLENLRRYFDKFEAPLPKVMESLRQNDNLERANANEYGWRDILMEELRLSRAEYALLSQRVLSDGHADVMLTVKRLYGYLLASADADVLAALSNAKTFTRRADISYEEIVEILKSRFVNPNSTLIPKLERLGVPFSTLKSLKDGIITDEAFNALLPPQIDPKQYGIAENNVDANGKPNIATWVKDDANYANIMTLITLTTPILPWAASTVYRRGDCVVPPLAPAGSTTYYECTTPGTSAGAEPSPWPTTAGNTHADGTVVWTCRVGLNDCSFDTLRFRYSDPNELAHNIRPFEFIRLMRFIRLWKKLGWTIEQTDKAITALYPSNQAPNDPDDAVNLERLDAGFLILLPRLGVVTRVMDTLNLKPSRDLLPLLACFAPIDTHGGTALYREMFLSPALLKNDPYPFADNGYGEFLTDDTQHVLAHAETLRAAFQLADSEFDQITVALGFDADSELTLENISAIFQRGWLARKLKLSVRELLLLMQVTGIDPFAAPDAPNASILRIVDLVDRLRAASLKPTQALYLIWNQDVSGRSALSEDDITQFARTLRAGLAAVESEFALADDPDGSIARARMAQVYGNEATDFFFGLLGNTFVTEVPYSHGQATLEPFILDAAPGRIAYDDFRKRLSFTGVLTAATRDALKVGVPLDFETAVDKLYEENQKVTGPFFARYPELLPLYNAYVASNDPVTTKRRTLMDQILPELVKRRKEQQALQAVSATVQTDFDFAQALLDASPAGNALHAADRADQPALKDFLALETQGLSVEFYANVTATGAVIPSDDIAANLDYAPAVGGIGNPLPANPAAGDPISGVWSGYLEAPESGFFNLHIEADLGATVTLTLDGQERNLTHNATLHYNTDPLELRAGTLYSIELKVENVRNIVHVQWEWEPKGQGRGVISARYLYPAARFDAFRNAYIRFLKAASLAAGLGLTANETAHFATHADYRINTQGRIDINGRGWLNALPNADNLDLANPEDAAIARTLNATLLTPFQALLDYARIKAELAPDDERLLTVLKDPTDATRNPDSLLFTLTRWDSASLSAILSRFGQVITDLGHVETFRRVYDAYTFVKKLRVPVLALITVATNEPNAATVRDFQAALRARYDEMDWLKVLRPINDEMRGLQRDALVAYILPQMRSNRDSEHIDTPDKLFEYFLMDVQMDPCMQTSRIRHALSSVQLFIERCLMDLELDVAPSSINAKQWEWMRRYRVWEANRKVFLFPNWLEPELRDDQSPFFKEAMSELLQSDITEDRAAIALLNYLSKLDEVAKLEPCGIYHVEGDQRTPEIDHVVARTAGANRKYYYRRREGGSWTPWEQIKLDIEDDPVIPVVWKGRLFLFWLRILKQAPLDLPQEPSNEHLTNEDGEEETLARLKMTDIKRNAAKEAKTTTKATVQAVLCWSEFYNGKWQPTKTSDVNRPVTLGRYAAEGPGAFDRSQLRLWVVEEGEEGCNLRVAVNRNYASFYLYNTHSLPEGGRWHDLFGPRRFFQQTPSDTLTIEYFKYWHYAASPDMTHQVLKRSNQLWNRVIEPGHHPQYPRKAPFLYEDSRHVFYVTTAEQPVPIAGAVGYGVAISPMGEPFPEFPPLVIGLDPQYYRPLPEEPGPAVEMGVDDPAFMQRFVSEDAYINKGFQAIGEVHYGEAKIGPAGARDRIPRL